LAFPSPFWSRRQPLLFVPFFLSVSELPAHTPAVSLRYLDVFFFPPFKLSYFVTTIETPPPPLLPRRLIFRGRSTLKEARPGPSRFLGPLCPGLCFLDLPPIWFYPAELSPFALPASCVYGPFAHPVFDRRPPVSYFRVSETLVFPLTVSPVAKVCQNFRTSSFLC